MHEVLLVIMQLVIVVVLAYAPFYIVCIMSGCIFCWWAFFAFKYRGRRGVVLTSSVYCVTAMIMLFLRVLSYFI